MSEDPTLLERALAWDVYTSHRKLTQALIGEMVARVQNAEADCAVLRSAANDVLSYKGDSDGYRGVVSDLCVAVESTEAGRDLLERDRLKEQRDEFDRQTGTLFEQRLEIERDRNHWKSSAVAAARIFDRIDAEGGHGKVVHDEIAAWRQEKPTLHFFVDAMNSGKAFRREGAVCSDGEPLWWKRHEVSQLLEGTDADGFMRLLNKQEWEIECK